MTGWLQVLLTLFYAGWAVAVLVLLARHAVLSGRRAERMQEAMVGMVERAQHNNETSAQAAHDLASVLVEMHRERQIERALKEEKSPPHAEPD